MKVTRHEFVAESPEERALIDALDEEYEKCRALLIVKNRDYGPRNISNRGALGVTVRLTDKVERLWNLLRKDEISVKSESLEDTARDVANYGLIMLLLFNGKWEPPHQGRKEE